jgi:hypothetical protein
MRTSEGRSVSVAHAVSSFGGSSVMRPPDYRADISVLSQRIGKRDRSHTGSGLRTSITTGFPSPGAGSGSPGVPERCQ